MSRLVTNAIRSTAASSDAMTIDSAGKPSFPNGGVGKLLQVVSTTKTDSTSTSTSGSFQDISGMSVTITPSSTSSKIFIIISLGTVSSNNGPVIAFKLLRGSTPVGNTADTQSYAGFTSLYAGNGSSNENMLSASHNFLDLPSTTSSTTYKLQWRNSSGTTYLNRYYGGNYEGSSTITAMEVAA